MAFKGLVDKRYSWKTVIHNNHEDNRHTENTYRLIRRRKFQRLGRDGKKCRFGRLSVVILALIVILHHAVIHTYWSNFVLLYGRRHYNNADHQLRKNRNHRRNGPTTHPLQNRTGYHHGSIHYLNSRLAEHYQSTQNTMITPGGNNHTTETDPYQTDSSTDSKLRYLIFRPPLQAAQGIGNLMHGLLAAHYLGEEFGRQVCISKEWKDFHRAFRSVDNDETTKIIKETTTRHPCSFVMQGNPADGFSPKEYDTSSQSITIERSNRKNTVWLLNFSKHPVNECELRRRLASDEPILYIVANAYPRWPLQQASVFEKSFDDLYRPRKELLDVLPWRTTTRNNHHFDFRPNSEHDKTTNRRIKLASPPSTVVHLRHPDGSGDVREGLDNATLIALGGVLPSSTYLVTNQVEYYRYFERRFGWNHPNWAVLSHSALPSVVWKPPKDSSQSMSRFHPRRLDGAAQNHILIHDPDVSYNDSSSSSPKSPSLQHAPRLQMWSDWYTIFSAQRVYHTRSDFSLSAVHWKNNGRARQRRERFEPHESFTIHGWDASTQRLILRTPSWSSSEESHSGSGASYRVNSGQGRVTVLPSSSQPLPPSLSQRSPQQLLHCDYPLGLDTVGVSNFFDLDDEIPI